LHVRTTLATLARISPHRGWHSDDLGQAHVTTSPDGHLLTADRPVEAPWLVATGDVVVQRAIRCDPRLLEVLTSTPVVFANLEAPLTERGTITEKAVTQRSDPGCVAELSAMGITAVTLANNHLLDAGPAGMRDTVEVLGSAEIRHVGAGEDAAESLAPAAFATEHGTVALLGLCSALPPGFAATEHGPGVAPVRVLQQVSVDPYLAAEQPGMAPYVHTQAHRPDVEAACRAVARARAEADLVVVAVHWGVPHGLGAPSYGWAADYQPPLGRALIDAGADLVVGHHPHVVHPVERYRDGLIAYSVGNLLFHTWAEIVGAAGETGGGLMGERFRLETPSAPYRRPFGGDEVLDSVLVLVQPPGPDGDLVVRFLPTTMVDGDPVIPDPGRCRAVLERLRPPASGPVEGQPEIRTREDLVEGAVVGEVVLRGRR
jgi:poly-gamma-glutamate synthesis protein (capsule biosynthesis protein)